MSQVPTVSGPSIHLWTDRTVPVIRLPEELTDFESLRACIREQMPMHVAAIGGRSIRLDLAARDIVLFDLRRVLHLLRQEFNVEVTGLYARPASIHKFAERELKLKLFPVERSGPLDALQDDEDEVDEAATEMIDEVSGDDDAVEPAELVPTTPLDDLTLPTDLTAADLDESSATPTPETRNAPSATPGPAPVREEGKRTQVIHRTLRSGSVVRFDGDLFVFGDVNPGAQVVATGNITVLGALKGMAHAGAAGDETAFILAFDLRPTQLRIGRKIAIPPERRSSADLHPEIAAVVDEQIVLEAYHQGRRR
ncbi:MAG: septum site-determining protein MinC [Myxococcales bacterium]|nr:septum site-determining protein MinC [Myxococcales bacterium]